MFKFVIGPRENYKKEDSTKRFQKKNTIAQSNEKLIVLCYRLFYCVVLCITIHIRSNMKCCAVD